MSGGRAVSSRAITSPFGVCIALDLDVGGVLDDGASGGPSAHPDEVAMAQGLGEARRRDFLRGRAALRAAMAYAAPELTFGAIAATPRGAPTLPPGWVGSISHKPGRAVGLVARDEGWHVGVDVEPARPPRGDVARRILTEAESSQLATLAPDAVTAFFAVKEAIYKAVDPYVQRYVGFREVSLVLPRQGPVPVTSDLGLLVEAYLHRDGEWLLAFARARR